MAIVPQQELPFRVEPVSPERVQLWAACAGYVSTRMGFDLISSAYLALWWQDAAYESYQAVIEVLGSGVYDVSSQVFYLDATVDALERVVAHWGRVIAGMRGLGMEGSQWGSDAMQQLHLASVLMPDVAHRVAFLCEQSRMPLPTCTQAFFVQR